MLSRLGDRLAAFFRATAPDPFVIAVLLTVVTVGLAVAFTPSTLSQTLRAWAGAGTSEPWLLTSSGMWALLGFSMQMCLILVTGHVLASSAPVSRALGALAGRPRSCAQAAALVATVSVLLGVLNWGLGLVAGALLARRVGVAMRARGVAVHYPLVAASGYTAMMIWHGGFSGSAPLTVSTRAGLEKTLPAEMAAGMDPIPLARTLFSPSNLVITGGLLVMIPLVMALLAPKRAQDMTAAPASVGEEIGGGSEGRSSQPDQSLGALPRFLETSPVVNMVLAAMLGFWALGYYVPADLSKSGVKTLSLDAVNMTMLMLGLLLHGTPRRFLTAVENAATGCAGIIIQFPLYAGIMGIMAGTGLTRVIADAIAGTATAQTLPLLTFMAACLVNLFVPSGGGQWAVQGPVALEAGAALQVDPARVVMAIAYGDQMTNMLQPFWALPLLAITGVKARDIIAYTAIVMVAGMVWVGVWLLVL